MRQLGKSLATAGWKLYIWLLKQQSIGYFADDKMSCGLVKLSRLDLPNYLLRAVKLVTTPDTSNQRFRQKIRNKIYCVSSDNESRVS